MQRRDFIRLTGLVATGTMVATSKAYALGQETKVTAADINKHLRSLLKVSEPSVDKVVVGDPSTEVAKIGTCWMPYWKTLKAAKEAGVNVMVAHEPTFYTGRDLDPPHYDYYLSSEPARANYFDMRDREKKWIEDNNMVVIRCHDVLDAIPGWGIPFSFGIGLGFSNDQIIRSKKFFNVYAIKPAPAIEVAKAIAVKLKQLHQSGVEFYGDKNYLVSTVGLGTGCYCDPLEYAELAPDLVIGLDDIIRTWIHTEYAEDSGKPLIVLNHGTSEEFGVRFLNHHLKEVYRGIDVIHFPQGCGYDWIT